MTFVVADRVQETCAAPGTGLVTLLGAASGYQSFSAGIGANNTTYYAIADQGGANWEVGLGAIGATGLTLARTTVLASSNGGSLVNFSVGIQNIWCDYAAGKAAIQDPNGVVTVPILATNSTVSTTPTLSFNAANAAYAGGASISGSYLQFLLQNKSATAGASVNYVISNNLGTDSTYYGEFGMNSSVFSSSTPTDFFSLNNGIYFSGHDGDITVGSGNGYKYYMAWGTTGQSAHVINASGAIGFSTNLGTTPALSGTTGYGTLGQTIISAGNGAPPAWGVLGVSGGGTGLTANFVNGIIWQLVQTSSFTAIAGNAYPINTTSGAITVTLPASPTSGQIVEFVDYAGTFATNNLTINPNGGKISGSSANVVLALSTESVALVYIDSTQGWIGYSGFSTSPVSNYLSSYLIVGGGGSGGSNSAGGGGAGGVIQGTTNLIRGNVYSIVVGAGGSGVGYSAIGVTGSNSSFITLSAYGGGYGGCSAVTQPGGNGGSGGGGGGVFSTAPGGSGTSGQGNAGGAGSSDAATYTTGGGGGGAGTSGSAASSSTGGNGGIGIASSITGSSIYYAGGGGGAGDARGPRGGGTGGNGGGGNGGYNGSSTAGSANTGGGSGGNGFSSGSSQNGGSGVVILSIPTVSYTGITTGSPTITTSGSNTIMKFTSSGSYTA